MAVTIHDVARQAGVSPATVSRVYNGSGLVRAATQARVLRAAQQLHYVPNATARSLSMSRTDVIGLILPVPHSEFFLEFMRGVDEAALAAGYNLLISGSHHSAAQLIKVLHMMQGRMDGLVLALPDTDGVAEARQVPVNCPVVFLHFEPEGARGAADSICIDNIGGARQAAAHLVGLGHRRIAILLGRVQNRDAHERLEGFRGLLREHGITPDPALEVVGHFTREGGYAAARQLLQAPDPPTALFASNDAMAIGALCALHEAGLRVPEQVSVVGFDDLPGSQFTTPALTTVRVPVCDMGRLAVARLRDRMEGLGAPRRMEAVLVPTELVVRASTAPCPA